MRSEEIAYAAGFVDADGSITVHRVVVKDRIYWFPQVNASNVDRRPLDFLCECFGGKVYPIKEKRSFIWILSKTSSLKRFLRAVLPFLQRKGRQARLAIKLCSLVGVQGRPVSASFLIHRERIALNIKKGNQEPTGFRNL